MKRFKSIELVALVFTGLLIIALIAGAFLLFANVNRFHDTHPGEPEGAEWSGLVLFTLIFGILYVSVFFIWLYRLWKTYAQSQKRKYLQLALIFVLMIFPAIMIIAHFTLTNFFHLEHPVTEKILKGYLYILLYPFTKGK